MLRAGIVTNIAALSAAGGGGGGAIFDAFSPTGAWSASRKLKTAYGGAYYNLTSSAVDTWYDQSGNTRNFTNGSPTFRPVISSVGPNSRDAIDFDGSNDVLAAANLSNFYTTTAQYAIISFLADNVSYNQANIHDCGTVMADQTGYTGMFIKNGYIYVMNNDGSFDFAPSTAVEAVSTATVYVAERWLDGGNINLRLNKGTTRTVASGATSALSSPLQIGANRNINQFFTDIKVFEMATFNAVPSGGDRDTFVDDFMDYAA